MGLWYCDFTFGLWWRAGWWRLIVKGSKAEAEAIFSGQLIIMRRKGRRTMLGGCWSQCMLYVVYAALGVCCTWCMLYLVSLMIMTWRDREGRLNFVLCDDGWVVDEKERDGRWRREQCGEYKKILEIRGTTCLIGLRRPHVGAMTHRLSTHTGHIGDGKLTCTWNHLKSWYLIMVCRIFCDISVSRLQLYYHPRTWS
jgi:hypothetical protein